MKYNIILIILFTSFFGYSQPNTDVFLFDLAIKNGNLTVSNFKNISDNDGYDNQPSFIDNNTLLYAGTRNGQTDIIKYDIETGRKKWISATEGSEYSPLKIPNKNRASAIRLEKDGSQKLYSYNLKKNVSKPLVDDIIIGYHTWFDNKTLISSVLEDGGLSLFITDINTSKNNKVDTNIGRSLHKIPNSNLVSYISKATENWEIRSLNPINSNTKFIVNTLANSEDICWTINGTILMGKGDILYKYNPKEDKNWVKITSLKKYGITNITRLATSPNGSKISIVGEPIIVDPNEEIIVNVDEKLEPTLENISWISGNWKGEAFGGITEENWSEPLGGSMMATFKLVTDNKVKFYEIEIIREVENSLILQLKHFHNDLKGWETKDETVDFPLKEITANKVVFEGMSFEKISENEMNVYVDIHKKNGAVETLKFNYTKD
ncbi:MAG: hypothetical protein COA67_01430 [Lutibacter sp.]|nr:MAG: hypothetical protein COA67_01430 [Lutibacter sp.]